MPHTTLITASQLQQALQGNAPLVLIDARFDLQSPQAGESAYRQGHLPGARYAHLNQDLSSAPSGRNGRHPLPAFEQWRQTVARWGVTPDTQVVAYDAQDGMFAARVWWLTRQLGHAAVAVLEGGMAAWQALGGPLDAKIPQTLPVTAPYPTQTADWPEIVEADTLLKALGRQVLIDARAPERYRGDVEPLDAVAGHIPGARNRFFKDNLMPDGQFKPAEMLRAEWLRVLDGTPAHEAVHQCGSGVTACHNLLALAVAGLPTGPLYPGSWSEWCSDPLRPVARG